MLSSQGNIRNYGQGIPSKEGNNHTIICWIWTEKSKGLQEEAEQSFTFGKWAYLVFHLFTALGQGLYFQLRSLDTLPGLTEYIWELLILSSDSCSWILFLSHCFSPFFLSFKKYHRHAYTYLYISVIYKFTLLNNCKLTRKHTVTLHIGRELFHGPFVDSNIWRLLNPSKMMHDLYITYANSPIYFRSPQVI